MLKLLLFFILFSFLSRGIIFGIYCLVNNIKKKQQPKKETKLPENLSLIMGIVVIAYLVFFLVFWIIVKNLRITSIILFGTILFALLVAYVIILNKTSKQYDKENWLKNLYGKEKVKIVLSSLLSIVIGLYIGCIILLLFIGKNDGGASVSLSTAIDSIQLIFFGALNNGRDASGNLIFGWNGREIGDMLFRATPLILTGLSVAVAFKTGLFNIGAPGQYLVGTASALIIALTIPSSVPAFITWILAFFGAILFGALWGALSGLFKAFLNVNEVITCIMTNWIAANLVTWLFDSNAGPFKFLLDPSGTKNNAYVFKSSHNGVATIKLGLDKIFAGSQVNAGIIIAIIIAIIVYIVLNKTTFGYELKACGANRHASRYAGIKEKRSIVFSMAIAGGLAAAAAALYYLSGNTEFRWETYQTLPATGFNGIPVSLLAANNPIGVCLSAIFMAYLDTAGLQIKYMTTYNEYITSIISAIIVYFSAFSLVIRDLITGNNRVFKFLKGEGIFTKKQTQVAENPTETKEVQG